MSGLPIFADPSTKVVYHTVPSGDTSGGGGFVTTAGHSQQAPPQSVAMMVVQNPQPPQHQQQGLPSGMPLPPGMEIVLGDKTYKILYQSYEMTREKANEYIAKCTGTPFSRMSAPPDPQAHYQFTGSHGGLGGTTSVPTTSSANRFSGAAADVAGLKPAAVSLPTAGDRGRAISEEKQSQHQQQQKTPDEVYTMMPPAAAGLPPAIARGGAEQHSQIPKVPEPQPMVPAYAPPPPPLPPQPKSNDPQQQQQQQRQQQNLGYYWEDGVWKVWQAGASKDTAGASITEASSASKMPSPQQYTQQHSQPTYPSQPEYQYQYHYSQQHPQHQPAPVVPEPSSYAMPHSQPQYLPPQQHPSIRGPPPPQPPPTGLQQAQVSAGTTHAPAPPGPYMI